MAQGAGERRAGWPRWARWILPDWVDRTVGVVLTARFAMSTARSIAGVVTALYLAAQGFSGLAIGVLFVCVTVASAVLSTTVGLLSDRVGRRPFLVVVPLLAAAAAAAYATSRVPVVLFVAAAVGSFGRGAGAGGGTVGPYQPAESALVAEVVPGGRRASAFGALTFASVGGALVGGLLATLAGGHAHVRGAAALVAYRPAFVAAAALAAVAGLLALAIPRQAAGRPGGPRSSASATGGRRRLRWPRRSWPALWRLSLTNAVNGAGVGLFGPFVSYWFSRRYGVGPAEVGLLFAVVNVASLASTLGAAWVGRRVGTVRAIVAVRLFSGLLLVPMALSPTFVVAGALFVVRMMAQRIGLPLRQSFSQDLADPDERASVAALSTLPSQVTMAGSQAFAGYLFDEVSLAAPMVLAAVFQSANAVLYATLFRGGGTDRGHSTPAERPPGLRPPDHTVAEPPWHRTTTCGQDNAQRGG